MATPVRTPPHSTMPAHTALDNMIANEKNRYSPVRKEASSEKSLLRKYGEKKDIEQDGDAGTPGTGTKPVVRQAHADSNAGGVFGFDATLQHKLVRCERKKELATFRLNQMQVAGSDVIQLTTELDRVVEEMTQFLLIADPAQLLNDVMSPATSQARSAYLDKLGKFEAEVKAGCAKHGWNLVAGGAGNFLCFGIGGAVGTVTGNPLIGLAVNTTIWTFAEPLISMMRATNVTNPYLDLYLVRQRLQARAAREALDGTSDLPENKKFAWSDPVSGDTEWLNAADWLARSSWLTLWSGKHYTDDTPYYLYSVAYGAANCLPEFTSASLYDKSTWQGMATSIGIRTGAGIIAGASLQECIQLLRARQVKDTGGREIVTKTLALWKEEAAWLASLLADIDSKRSHAGVDPIQKQALDTLHRSVLLWHEKAVAKSALTTSVLYEWRAMVQSKREAIGIDPELPGKRLDTAASFIGKALSQGAGIAVGTLAPAAVRSAMPWARWAGYLAPPLAAIGMGGFIIRRELEASARVMLGAAQGLGRRCCGGNDDEY